MDKLLEFFEADNGRLSMTRLTMFLAFWPAAYEVVRINSESALGIFLGVFVGGYLGGKGTDIFMKPQPKQKAPK